MDRAFMKKKAIISEGKNGDKTLEILNVAAYFAPIGIRIGVFSSIISDRSELKAAILSLNRQSLVKCPKENTFFISESIGAKLRHHLGRLCVEEIILKRAIQVLSQARLNDHPHFVSVYKYAKGHPKVLEELDDLPGRAIVGMVKEGKYREAVKFGKECDRYLTDILGEHHRTVMNLECALGLPLLIAENREDAIKILTTTYRKYCNFGRDIDVRFAMNRLGNVIFSNTPPINSLRVFLETHLRSIIFSGLTVSECNNDSDLKRWMHYAAMIHTFSLTEEAISILNDVIKRRVILFDRDDDGICAAMELKASFLADEPEAVELLKCICEKRRKMFGPFNRKTLGTKNSMGKVLFQQGNLKEATTLYEDVTCSIKQIDKESIVFYETAMRDLIKICMIQEDFVKALKLSSDLLDKYVSIYGDIHPKCLTCRKQQSDLFLILNKPERALEVLKHIIEDYKYELDEVELEYFHLLEMRISENIRVFDAPDGTLHSFAKDGNLEMVLSLIESGKDIESKDSTGMTPLHYASVFGQVEVAKALIKKGAKNPSRAHSGPTPLEVATGSQMKTLLKTVHTFYEAVKADHHDDILDIALREPCVLGAKDGQGCTPLHWAALHDYRAVFRLLLEFDSDPTVVSDKGNSPLHIAASKGHVVIVETLLRALGPAEATLLLDGRTFTGGYTPLHAAAEKGQAEMVRILLTHGAVCSTKSVAGKTPLQVSEDWGCRNLLGLVEGLFQDTSKGDVADVCAKLRGLESADVLAVSRARNEDHRTLLQEAMKRKNLVLAKKLVKLLKYIS